LGLLTCKTVSQITYTVLVETLNTAQSINHCLFNSFLVILLFQLTCICKQTQTNNEA